MNEFNASATPPEEIRRKLLYHAMTGNVMVASGFSVPEAFNPEAIERKDREFYAQMRLVLASRERVEQFTAELDRLDESAAMALQDNESQLREAREEIRNIRERAYEVRRDDGTVVKVYRDGEIVREDDGTIVTPDAVRVDAIPDRHPTWAERRAAGLREEDLMRRNTEIREYQGRVERGRKLVESGRVTNGELDDMKADLDRMPADVRAHLQPERATQQTLQRRDATLAPVPADDPLATSLRPLRDFAAVAPGASPAAQPAENEKLTPQSPTASAPAPM